MALSLGSGAAGVNRPYQQERLIGRIYQSSISHRTPELLLREAGSEDGRAAAGLAGRAPLD
jgi:hypothetical protein